MTPTGEKASRAPVGRLIVRLLALLLVLPIVALIFLPGTLPWYPSRDYLIATVALLFRLGVIVLAIYVFATAKDSDKPGDGWFTFLMFALASALNPIEVASFGSDLYCRDQGGVCEGVSWTAFALKFVEIWAPFVVLELAAFALLFVIVRVAAGKAWPGRPTT